MDGDDTGRELERLFQGNFEAAAFTRFSKGIDNAMGVVADLVKKEPIRVMNLLGVDEYKYKKAFYRRGDYEAV